MSIGNREMTLEIDYSVYPDRDGPVTLETLEERADYVQRVCAAWDFGIPPTPATTQMFAEWIDVFDRYPLPHSLSYHAFRAWYGWPGVEAEPSLWAVLPEDDFPGI